MLIGLLKIVCAGLILFIAPAIYAAIRYPQSDIKLIIKYGFPGVGKTVDIVRESVKAYKKGRKVYTNVDDLAVPGTLKIKSDDYGKYRFYGDCLLLIDEGGIVFNNRNWKKFTDSIEYSKLHRHDKCRIIIYSQSPEDTDITLRRLAQESWDMKKILGCYSFQRRIINENTIVKATNEDGTQRGSYGSNQKYRFDFKFYYMPWYYGMTDTHAMPERFKQIPYTITWGKMPFRFCSHKQRAQRLAGHLKKKFKKGRWNRSKEKYATTEA